MLDLSNSGWGVFFARENCFFLFSIPYIELDIVYGEEEGLLQLKVLTAHMQMSDEHEAKKNQNQKTKLITHNSLFSAFNPKLNPEIDQCLFRI